MNEENDELNYITLGHDCEDISNIMRHVKWFCVGFIVVCIGIVVLVVLL